MKLWEVMRLLEENPKREFEAKLKDSSNRAVMSVDNSFGQFYMFDVYNKDGSIIGGTFNGNVSLNFDWNEVKHPVTWQKAIEAWGSGRTIKKCFPNSEQTYPSGTTIHLTKNDVVNGTWYVED